MTLVKRLVLCGAFFGFMPVVVCAQGTAKKDKEPDTVSYYKDVRPIFQQNCQGCHQPAKAHGGYLMTNYAELLKKSDTDSLGVVPHHPDKSTVIRQITPQNGKPPEMPRGKDPLSDRDVRIISRWIAQGAKDDTPASAKGALVDGDHPPVYELPPVITALAYSPSGEYLAVSGYHEVLLHTADGSRMVARLVGLSERVQSLAFSPDSKLLAVTGGDPGRFGEVQIWDVAKKKLKLSLPVTFDTVYGVSWSFDGKKLAFGCADNSVRAIDPENGKQILFQGGHSDWVLDTVWSKDAANLVSVSRDQSMKLTEVATERLIDNITSITPGALKGGLQTVDRHPQNNNLLVGGADGVPRIYQMFRTKARVIGDDFNLLKAFPAMPGRVFSARFSPDGNRIIAGSSYDRKGEAHVFQVADGKQVKLEGQSGPVYAVAYRPDGQQVASGGFDGVVRLSNPNDGKLVREFVPFPLNTKTSSK